MTQYVGKQVLDTKAAVAQVATAAALAALDVAQWQRADYADDSTARAGIWRFDPTDKSAEVTADTAQWFFIAPAAAPTGAAGAWVRRAPRGPIDVTKHGLDPYGGTDCTAPLLALIASLPDDTNTRDSFIGWSPIPLFFPSYADQLTPAQYRFDTLCVIPGEYNFRLTSDAAFGARLINNTGGDYIFEIELDSVGRNKTFENLFFDGAGLQMAGRVRGLVEVHHCAFRDAPDWSIWMSNEGPPDYLGPVGPYVHDCFFMDSGGINIDCDTYLVMRIERCRFFRSTTESISVDGPGVFIDGCDFQEMEIEKSKTRGHIHLPSTRGTASDIRITNCRWGVEGDGITTAVPKWAITAGDPQNPVDVTLAQGSNLIIQNNRFGGTGSQVVGNPNHGQAVLGLFARFARILMSENLILGYESAIIDDDYVINNTGGNVNQGGVTNLYSRNLDVQHRVTENKPLFKNTSYSWQVDILDGNPLIRAGDSDGSKFQMGIYGGALNGALGWGGEGILLNAYNDPTRKIRVRVNTNGVLITDEQVSASYTAMPDGKVDI